MTPALAHCLVFAAGIAAISAPLPPEIHAPAAPAASHIVATATTAVRVDIVADAFAPATPGEIEAFVARAPFVVA